MRITVRCSVRTLRRKRHRRDCLRGTSGRGQCDRGTPHVPRGLASRGRPQRWGGDRTHGAAWHAGKRSHRDRPNSSNRPAPDELPAWAPPQLRARHIQLHVVNDRRGRGKVRATLCNAQNTQTQQCHSPGRQFLGTSMLVISRGASRTSSELSPMRAPVRHGASPHWYTENTTQIRTWSSRARRAHDARRLWRKHDHDHDHDHDLSALLAGGGKCGQQLRISGESSKERE